MLKFDKNGLANEILNKLEIELKWALNYWKTEAENRMRNEFSISNRYIDYKIEKEVQCIISYLQANTYVLADSYGTGSLMLDDNPGFQKYKATWHSDRPDKAIRGRKQGSYVDIFGRPRKTSGAFRGVNIEYMTVHSSEEGEYKITPMKPSYALQDAEKSLYVILDRVYKNAIQSVNFSRFLIES